MNDQLPQAELISQQQQDPETSMADTGEKNNSNVREEVPLEVVDRDKLGPPVREFRKPDAKDALVLHYDPDEEEVAKKEREKQITSGAGAIPPVPLEDSLSRDRERKITRKEALSEQFDTMIRHLHPDLPTTKLLHIRLKRRNEISGSYENYGSRKNVDLNEVRDLCTLIPFDGRWIIGTCEVSNRIDDPKAWKEWVFERKGPSVPNGWALDNPLISNDTVVEVEGMGSIPLNDLKEVLAGMAVKIAQDMGRGGSIGPEPTIRMPESAQVNPLREEVQKLQAALDEQRRAAEAARTEALSARHSSEMEAIRAELRALKDRPVTSPGPDLATAFMTALPHIKEIFTASRDQEAQNRQREKDEFERERQRQREEFERRRMEDERERERARAAEERTLSMYKTIGELITAKNDTTPAIEAAKAVNETVSSNVRLMATLAQSGMFGNQQPGVDWGSVLANGIETIGGVLGPVIASKMAERQQAPALPPQQSVQQQPQPQPVQQQQPLSGMAEKPQAVVLPPLTKNQVIGAKINELSVEVAKGIFTKGDPDEVSDLVIQFGELLGSTATANVGLRLIYEELIEAPFKMLMKHYPQADPDYVMTVAEAVEAKMAEDEVEEEADNIDHPVVLKADVPLKYEGEKPEGEKVTGDEGNGGPKVETVMMKRRGRPPRTKLDLPAIDQAVIKGEGDE